METKILEEIGLTPGEIKTYLALLSLRSSSTGPIAKKSGVSRSKLYIILDKLEKKGFVSHIEKDGVLHFQAVEPQKIKDYLERKEEEIKTLEKRFEKFLPQLESFYERGGRVQKVTVYQGLKGLATAHEHTYLKLKRGEEYVYLGVPKHQPEKHHMYWKRDHERRARAGIKCRLLFTNDTEPKVLKSRNSYPGCDARYMSIDIKTPSYFAVYKDTVLIAIPSDHPLAIEIISQEIADSFMLYFEEFWRKSKKFKSK